jgi:hypothetical protein
MARHPYECMKLITKANVLCPYLDIDKSKRLLLEYMNPKLTLDVVTLATNEGMAC